MIVLGVILAILLVLVAVVLVRAAQFKPQETVRPQAASVEINKEKIVEALSACSNFCCGECPYQHLESKDYPLRCIHALIQDTYDLLREDF